MIKIFRNIRQNMITQNSSVGRTSKVSNYLPYASGEIVLVIIGILIRKISTFSEIIVPLGTKHW